MVLTTNEGLRILTVTGVKIPGDGRLPPYRPVGTFRAVAGRCSHSVAGENSLAALTKPCPVLLKASLNRSIISQLMPTETRCVPSARCLLLRHTHVALREARRDGLHQTD